MERVFEGLSEVAKQRLLKGVEESVKSFWGSSHKDFKRFNLGNGSSALIKFERLSVGSDCVSAQFSNPKCKVVETATVYFRISNIARKGLFAEKAKELSLEVAMLLTETHK